MEEKIMREFLQQAPFGYAYHKILLNKQGEAVDYIFLDINPAFEEMMGLKREFVIGKRVTELLPGDQNGSFDWIGFYKKAALDGEKRIFNQDAEAFGRCYKINVFAPRKGYFVTIFHEITQKDRIEVLEKQQVKYTVGSSKDITLQKQIGAKLKKRLKYEKIISQVSQLALQEKSLDVFLTKALRYMGEGIGVSRTYLFERDFDNRTISNTFEWISPGVTPQKENLQDIPEAEFTWWMDKLKNREAINFRDIEKISDEQTKEILRSQDIMSILVLPTFIDGVCSGFIGFDDCFKNRVWSESDIDLLKIAAEVISQFISLHKKEEKLWEENQRFKAMISSTEDVIFELDKEQRHVAIFGKWLKQAGLEPEAFLGKRARDIFGLEKAYIHEEANKKALAGENTLYEWSIEQKGRKKFYQTSLSPIKDREGKVCGIVGVGRDITELINIQQELQKEKELLRTTLLSIGDGVVTTDCMGIITSMNNAAEEITGLSEENVKGRPFSDVIQLVNEVSGKKVQDPVNKVLHAGKKIGLGNNTVLITKEGRRIPVADSAAPIKDEKGSIFGAVMVYRDVTIEKNQQEKILYLSYHDSLTGLYNRRFMEEELKRLGASRELPFAVIMGDLNGLKLVNDVFGHEAGDALLKRAAKIIKRSCRKEDIIARWGGDEFLILLPRTDERAAESIINRIRARCLKDDSKTTKVSIALGYAVRKKASEALRQTLQEAEEWMYRQKLMEGQSYRNAVIKTMLTTLWAKSMETKEHAQRLQKYCVLMGEKLKLSPQEIDELVLLAMLHDIGKVAINENILKKDGPLTSAEWEEIEKHPEIGYRIARNIPELAGVAEYILFHHERWDGKGYPRGLKGKEIPLLCRILAVADAYDAMTNDRSYREAVGREKAVTEIKKNSGTQFDPEVVNAFCLQLDEN